MKPAPLPINEADRLKALQNYQLLDTLPEEVYDDITRIATEITGMPIALLSLIDKDRQWFKSRQGLDINETPREFSFCAHAILEPDEMMIVEDARYDERFHDNPLTTGDPHVVFYAGVPIVDADQHAFGTLCVIDSRPRNLPENKQMALKALAKLINVHFELRKTKLELARIHEELSKVTQQKSTPEQSQSDQAQALIDAIQTNVQALIKSDPRPDQTPHLALLQQATETLKTVLETT